LNTFNLQADHEINWFKIMTDMNLPNNKLLYFVTCCNILTNIWANVMEIFRIMFEKWSYGTYGAAVSVRWVTASVHSGLMGLFVRNFCM
jgi:hypothetical protein